MGIDLNTLKGKELIKNYGKFFFFISCVVYIQFGLINFVIRNGITNLDQTSGAMSMFNQGCLILFKIAVLLYKGDNFMKLMWDINNLAAKANPEENKNWLSENLRTHMIAKLYFYVCWVALFCSIIFPLVLMAHDYNQDRGFIQKLPFGGAFPYDNGHLLYFIVNYMMSIIYIYSLLNMLVGPDTLYFWYIHSISAHFRILRCQVYNSGLKLQESNCFNFSQDIRSIVSYHNRILDFVAEVNAVYGEILLLAVLLSSLQVCFIIYTLLNDENVFNMPFTVMCLIIVTIQLIIYCFGGAKIKNESSLLSLDFYLSFPWHLMSIKEKKLMLLPLVRSQRLPVLRGFFFEIDRNLLIYILKTAFSVNALLSAMKE